MSDYLSPLRRAERFLGMRLAALERRLGDAPPESPLWDQYTATTDAFAKIRAQLYGATTASVERRTARGARPDPAA